MVRIAPMLAKLSAVLPKNEAEYGFEIKWDGLRAIVYCQAGAIRIDSRNNRDITEQYPELAAIPPALKQHEAVLDGEIVALAEDGRPSFSILQHRMNVSSPAAIAKLSKQIPVSYMVFDILSLDGTALLELPYTERRQILDSLPLNNSFWQAPSYSVGAGQELLAVSRKMHLEGIVAKRLDSIYEPGKRTGAWLKIKNQRRQELVIGGWAEGKGARQGRIGALLVGYYPAPFRQGAFTPAPKLIYAGRVGTGFTQQTLKELAALLKPLAQPDSPFAAGELPAAAGVHFVQPKLVGEFEFTEWTPHHTLRHPSFKGLRFDKAQESVIREPID